MSIEESMHVKFEKSNSFVKNIIENNSLREDMEKISLKDSPVCKITNQEMMQIVQEVEVEPTQPLSKDWSMLQAILKISS